MKESKISLGAGIGLLAGIIIGSATDNNWLIKVFQSWIIKFFQLPYSCQEFYTFR